MDRLFEALQFSEQQQSQKALLKGKKPWFTKSAQELRLQHRHSSDVARVSKTLAEIASRKVKLVSKNSFQDRPASKTPVKNLKRIALRDLRILEVAEGSYVILRTLEPAYKDISIITVVEDHKGNAVYFHATNITAELNPDMNDVLPVGTVFILKEPCIELSISEEYTVFCESPSDMIVLHEGHELFGLADGIAWKNNIDPQLIDNPVTKEPKPTSALGWKERGNAIFKAGRFERATCCYLLALKELEVSGDRENLKRVLHLNLSAVYLKRGFFENALEFARKVLVTDPTNGKALFRAGKSCYQLRKFEDARRYFAECRRFSPMDEDVKKELKKSEDRLLEQTTGVFDFDEFYRAKTVNPGQRIDCADYVGPIKIIEMPGKGRGVVATRDIEPGTLLEASRALSYSWNDESKSHVAYTGISMDEKYALGFIQDNVAQIAQLIIKNPNTYGPIVYDLYDRYHPVKDKSSNLFCDPETKKEPIVDAQRITGIVKSSSFGLTGTLYDFLNKSKGVGSGLFALSSYFNHSCLPNTVSQNCFELGMTIAINFIKAGEEVYVQYCAWQKNLSYRQCLIEKYGYSCSCQLCQQDRAVEVSLLSKREEIQSQCAAMNKQFNTVGYPDDKNALICILEQLIDDMDATYKNSERRQLKIAMAPLYDLLGVAYNKVTLINKQIDCCHSVLKLFGFDPPVMFSCLERGMHLISPEVYLDQYVFHAVVKLIMLYSGIGHREMLEKWIQILHFLSLCYCDDIRFLRLEFEHDMDFIQNMVQSMI